MNYFLTSIYDGPGIFKHRKSRRTFGYFHTLDDAIRAVQENRCNMHECLYNYLVIEGIGEGVHGICEEEYWFEWSDTDNNWLRIPEKPEFFRNVINFALG